MSFESLIAEAEEHSLGGWDFSWIREGERYTETKVPWDYHQLVQERARVSPDLLDIGTGGGERLASLAPLPPRTLATESYPPNVPVAQRRLSPLGIQVVQTSEAPITDSGSAGRLPFPDASFHLVICRNSFFVAREVARVLQPRGILITEQTGSNAIPELCELLGLPVHPNPYWRLGDAKRQLEQAGLRVTTSEEAWFEMAFRDVGALVWYLRMIPWVAPGFSVNDRREQLLRIHAGMERDGPLTIPRYGFCVEAVKD